MEEAVIMVSILVVVFNLWRNKMRVLNQNEVMSVSGGCQCFCQGEYTCDASSKRECAGICSAAGTDYTGCY